MYKIISAPVLKKKTRKFKGENLNRHPDNLLNKLIKLKSENEFYLDQLNKLKVAQNSLKEANQDLITENSQLKVVNQQLENQLKYIRRDYENLNRRHELTIDGYMRSIGFQSVNETLEKPWSNKKTDDNFKKNIHILRHMRAFGFDLDPKEDALLNKNK